MLSPPKLLDETTPKLVCDYSHEFGVQQHTVCFGPAPLGPWVRSNGQIHVPLNFNYVFNFKVYLNQTLYVFSQIKDMKHIELDFHSVAGPCPMGGSWVKNYFTEHGHVAYQIEGDGDYNSLQVKILPNGQAGDSGLGSIGLCIWWHCLRPPLRV